MVGSTWTVMKTSPSFPVPRSVLGGGKNSNGFDGQFSAWKLPPKKRPLETALFLAQRKTCPP